MADRIAMAMDIGAQTLRFGWFYGINQLVDRETRRLGAERDFVPTRPVPTRRELLDELRRVVIRDAELVRDGVLPPQELPASALPGHLTRLRAMFRDLPEAVGRRQTSDAATVRSHAAAGDLPDYFAQDFHFQTGGYLTEESARLYDAQVETLFYGSAQLMRRSGVADAVRAVHGRDQRKLALADIACGTGRLLRDVRRALPAIRLTGVDLSHAYLAEAQAHMGRLRAARFIAGNAETIPLPDASQDIVTTVFLFHELPPDVRRTVAREFARVLKPGGRLIFVDSLQMGDQPGWDGLLEAFPVRFHEPYYRHYAIDDLDGLFTDVGLAPLSSEAVFLSKQMVRQKV